MKNRDRCRGCMIGGAAGDALGYAVEFLPEELIFMEYGENGITRYQLEDGLARISDDTQMSLFTAEGLLQSDRSGTADKMLKSCREHIRAAYLDWLQTQTMPGPAAGARFATPLAALPEMYSQRAPGNTCLSALEQGGGGSVACPINRSKGCGGLMRVAPIGLCFGEGRLSLDQIDLLGAEAAAMTHGHELGYLPAAMLVHIVYLLSHDERQTVLSAVRDALLAVERLFPDAEHRPALEKLVRKAIALSAETWDDLDALRELGQGWVAEETLAIAVYCALRYEHDFGRALIAAVNHGGDSDSTGAVTGNILGARLGYQAIPPAFTQKLELHDLIARLADELYDCGM